MTAPKKKPEATPLTLNEELEKYGIELPEGTSDEIKKMFLDKHEEGLAAVAAANQQAEEISASAAREIQAVTNKLEQVKNAPRPEGFGTFKRDGETYTINMAQTKGKLPDEPHSRLILAEEFRTNVELQNVAIAEGWGIVSKIVKS